MPHRVLIACAILAFPALAQSPADAPQHARYIAGLDNIQSQKSGKLSLQHDALLFDAGSSQAKVPVSSMDDIFIGDEVTQSTGKTGDVLAVAAPYWSGRLLSAFTRRKEDILTILYCDSNAGLHSAIFALPKDTAAGLRMRLVAAGAHTTVPTTPVEAARELLTRAPSGLTLKQVHAIQIQPLDAGNVNIPPEFRYAIYERLIDRLRRDGEFQNVFRSGDRRANSVADLVVLHTTVSRFKEGSQTKRELTSVAGSTAVYVNATISRRDGIVIWNNSVQGRVLYFGENLGVANDVSKRIAKLLREATQAKP